MSTSCGHITDRLAMGLFGVLCVLGLVKRFARAPSENGSAPGYSQLRDDKSFQLTEQSCVQLVL